MSGIVGGSVKFIARVSGLVKKNRMYCIYGVKTKVLISKADLHLYFHIWKKQISHDMAHLRVLASKQQRNKLKPLKKFC